MCVYARKTYVYGKERCVCVCVHTCECVYMCKVGVWKGEKCVYMSVCMHVKYVYGEERRECVCVCM